MSQESSNVSKPSVEEYVVCPFNSSHNLLPSRLAVHLIRCSRNYPDTKKVYCPYNNTHIHTVQEMKKHIGSCPNRFTLKKSLEPDKMAPVGPPAFFVDSTENWNDEPPAPTYNPEEYCERNFIIRNPQGNGPAVRREFRARERRRFIDNDKF